MLSLTKEIIFCLFCAPCFHHFCFHQSKVRSFHSFTVWSLKLSAAWGQTVSAAWRRSLMILDWCLFWIIAQWCLYVHHVHSHVCPQAKWINGGEKKATNTSIIFIIILLFNIFFFYYYYYANACFVNYHFYKLTHCMLYTATVALVFMFSQYSPSISSSHPCWVWVGSCNPLQQMDPWKTETESQNE